MGHVDGFSIRVFDGHGEITEAFKKYHELAEQMDDYPILDESDYSERELTATFENIDDAAWRLKKKISTQRSGIASHVEIACQVSPSNSAPKIQRSTLPDSDTCRLNDRNKR